MVTKFMLTLGAVCALAGCASGKSGQALRGPTSLDAFAPRVVEVEERRAVLTIGGGDALTPADDRAIRGMTALYRTVGQGPIIIGVPDSLGAEDPLARQVADAIYEGGVARQDILFAPYTPGPQQKNEIVLGFKRFEAIAQPCPSLGTVNLAQTLGTIGLPNLGCVVNSNIAAMTANPADLLGPRAEGPSSADRRQRVIEVYKQGQPTQTPRGPGETVILSDAVN